MNTRISVVGPIPPPVHGFSEITRTIASLLNESERTDVINTSSSVGFMALAFSFVRFFFKSLTAPKGVLYLAFSGGLRQLFDLGFVFVALLCRQRIFVHHHSFAYLNSRKFYTWFVLLFVKNAVHITLCECMAKKLCDFYGVKSDNIRIVSNSAFLNEKIMFRRRGNPELILGFLSNISAAKGCFDFINLVKRAHDEGLAVRGLMAGPVQIGLEDDFRVALSDVAGVAYLGPVYGAEKEEFLSNLDILVFPTRYENEAEPVTIWEAFSSGVPVISLKRGCIEEIFDVKSGWLIDSPDSFLDDAISVLRGFKDNRQSIEGHRIGAFNHFITSKRKFGTSLNSLLAEITGSFRDSRSF